MSFHATRSAHAWRPAASAGNHGLVLERCEDSSRTFLFLSSIETRRSQTYSPQNRLVTSSASRSPSIETMKIERTGDHVTLPVAQSGRMRSPTSRRAAEMPCSRCQERPGLDPSRPGGHLAWRELWDPAASHFITEAIYKIYRSCENFYIYI